MATKVKAPYELKSCESFGSSSRYCLTKRRVSRTEH